MISIKPIKRDNYNCYEAVVVSLMNYYNKEYELIFLNKWFFEFEEENNVLFNRIISSFINFDILREYYGLDIILFQTKQIDFNLLKTRISEEIPLIADIDAFYCPWNKAFNKRHIYHICLIIDVDMENEKLICIDPFISEDIIEMQFKDFLDASTYAFWEVHNQASCKTLSDFSADMILESLVGKLDAHNSYTNKEHRGGINVVDCINKNIGSYLRDFPSYDNYEDLYNDPFIINLKFIENTRMNICTALDHYLKRTGLKSDILEDIMHKMYDLVELWKRFKILVIRDIVRNSDCLSAQTKNVLAQIGELEAAAYDLICGNNA